MNKKIMVLAVAVLAGGALAGAFFGARALYQNGVEKGREEAFDETKTSVENLGATITEKNDFQKKINEVLNNVPAEVNTESISAYINSLDSIANETKNENVKEVLINYLNKWKEFQNTYASQDNNAITAAFNDLKTTAIDSATNIKTIYDQAITSAIESL